MSHAEGVVHIIRDDLPASDVPTRFQPPTYRRCERSATI